MSPQWKLRVLTTGHPGKSLALTLYWMLTSHISLNACSQSWEPGTTLSPGYRGRHGARGCEEAGLDFVCGSVQLVFCGGHLRREKGFWHFLGESGGAPSLPQTPLTWGHPCGCGRPGSSPPHTYMLQSYPVFLEPPSQAGSACPSYPDQLSQKPVPGCPDLSVWFALVTV